MIGGDGAEVLGGKDDTVRRAGRSRGGGGGGGFPANGVPTVTAEAPRARLRVLAALVAAELLCMSLWFSASAVVPQLREEWSFGGATDAWLIVAVQLGFVAGALGSALLNLPDRIPNERLIALCALIGAAATGAITLPGVGPGAAIALRFVTGAALAGIYPPGMKLAASWSGRDRGFVLGVLIGALALGTAAPHLFNAVAGGLPPWRAALLTSAGSSALGGLLVLLFVRPGPELARSAPFDWRAAGRVIRDRPVWLANLGYLGHMWEIYAMWTWIPPALLESYAAAELPTAAARLAGFGSIATGALGCVAAGRSADRVGRTLVASLSLVVSGACCLAAGFVLDQPVLFTGLCLVWGFAVVADSAQFSAAVSELADPRYVGTALTLQTSLGFLLSVVSIFALPALVPVVGTELRFAVLAVGPAVGVWAMLRLRALPEATRMAGGRR